MEKPTPINPNSFKKNPWREAEKKLAENQAIKAPSSLQTLPHRVPNSKSLEGKSVIAFGSSLRLVSHARLHSEFAAFGLSLKGFRALLRALSIPSIQFGKQQFVDSTVFYIAMHAILRPGEPDFLAPGTTHRARRRKSRSLPSRTSITSEWLLKQWDIVAQELIYTRDMLEPRLTPSEIRTATSAAAARLREFALQVPSIEFFNVHSGRAQAYYHSQHPSSDTLPPKDPPDAADPQ